MKEFHGNCLDRRISIIKKKNRKNERFPAIQIEVLIHQSPTSLSNKKGTRARCFSRLRFLTWLKLNREQRSGWNRLSFFVCLRQSPAFLREEEVDYLNVSSFSMLFIGRSIDRRGMPTVLTLFQLGLCSFFSLNTKRAFSVLAWTT